MKDSNEQLIFDFIMPATTQYWQSIDDRIMGGISESHPHFVKDIGMRFYGTVSLENNGGFASIRSGSANYDLKNFSGLKIRAKGDGKTYKLSLRTDRYFDGVSYQKSFTTTTGWEEITLPFSAFSPTHHGQILKTVAPLDRSKIQSFGLFIADQQIGPFQLDVAWIKAFRD